MKQRGKLSAGDWVQVRTKEEILRTLDRRGRLDGLPFMPQMFDYCGRRFRVFKRAHKTCDTVHDYKGRKMRSAVHLEGIRCDGQAYGGCEAFCLLFWKEEWLQRVSSPTGPVIDAAGSSDQATSRQAGPCSEQDVLNGTRADNRPDETGAQTIYTCQATDLPTATAPLPWWDMRQYLEDLTSGNVSPVRMVRGLVYVTARGLINLGIGWGPLLRCIYDFFQRLWAGVPFPQRPGLVPPGERTPTADLNLQPGELVRVKCYQEILTTLDQNNKNRGMFFDAESVPYCGGTYRVLRRVTRIIDERSGKMVRLSNPCITLDGVVCGARYAQCRMFCPRSIYPYWREIWLERVGTPVSDRAPARTNGGATASTRYQAPVR